MTQRASYAIFIIFILSVNSYSYGEENEGEGEGEEHPSLELLEFLAEFKNSNDEWVDPIALEEFTNETDTQDMEQKNETD